MGRKISQISAMVVAVMTSLGLLGASCASLPGGAETFRHIRPYIVVIAAMFVIMLIFALVNKGKK